MFTTPSGHGLPRRQALTSLLQEQQATLQCLLEGQTSIQQAQLALNERVLNIEKQMSSSHQATVQSSSPLPGKRKNLVTRELSVSVFVCINY